MCPTPGLMIEPTEIKLQRIQRVQELLSEFYSARVQFQRAKNELGFWNVRLQTRFEQNHLDLTKQLNNIAVVGEALNSQLRYYTLQSVALPNVANEKQRFDEFDRTITTLLNERISLGFDQVFTFRR
jgi:hypothetical protein